MLGILDSMSPPERSWLVVDIVSLMTQSNSHGGYKIQHMSQIVLPLVQLNQYRIYHDDKGSAVGFVSWAMLSEAA